MVGVILAKESSQLRAVSMWY